LAFIAPTAGRVDIDIAIALARFLVVHRHQGRVTIVPSSLTVELPSRLRRPSPLRRALHHPLFAIAPSIAAHRLCALGPSPPRSRRRGAIAPSLTVEEPKLLELA